MQLGRVILIISGLIFLGFGLAFLLRPAESANWVGITGLKGAAGVTEIRTVYGGLQVGVGAFLLICALPRMMITPGLVGAVVVFGGMAGGRLLGILMDEPDQAMVFVFLGVEVAMMVMGIVGLVLGRKRLTLTRGPGRAPAGAMQPQQGPAQPMARRPAAGPPGQAGKPQPGEATPPAGKAWGDSPAKGPRP